jgi:hypothetical protein
MLMMIVIDFVNVKTRGKLQALLSGGRKWRQYVVSSALAVTPGCLGAFAGVSLYIHGMISFGALTGLMFAASGDEMFVMLAMFPKTALFMIALLFVLGIGVGFLTDYLVKKLNISTCSDCEFEQYHPGVESYKHYFREHVWTHIIKGHLIKTFLWTFGALLIVEYGMSFVDLKSLTSHYSFWVLVLSAFIGLLPESGPHLIFVMLFAKGFVPFSVLFTSSIVQDGHGMLPLLSYSVKDSFRIKVFNLIFGLSIGAMLYLLGY